MPDYLSPEPIRAMYDSDESHAAAWLQWASATPGGWQARLADKVAAGQTPPDEVPGAWTTEPSDPEKGTELVRYVRAPSPCCRADVMIDPFVAAGTRGICSTCATLLDDAGPWWVSKGPGPEAG